MGFLDKVELAFTCPLAWEKLQGGAAKKYCEKCDKHVTNLSTMSRRDAEAFLRVSPGPICVRVEVDATGRSVHRPLLPAGAFSLALATSPMGSCSGTPTTHEVMGDIAIVETPVEPVEPMVVMGAPRALPPEPVEPPTRVMMGKRAVR